jgi:hypothetical protein
MQFRDVVICDNARCGAILRITDAPGPISVVVLSDSAGSFVACPRCGRRTAAESLGDVTGKAPGLPATDLPNVAV